MAYYIQPVKRLAEELDDDVTEDMLNTKTFEEEDSEIDISHFGSFEILQSKELNIELDDDFFIDLSNIDNIDKIIYRGIEIKLIKELNSYITNFNIKDLETLL